MPVKLRSTVTKRLLLSLTLALLLLATPLVALADTWSYYVEFTVSDNISTDHTAFPVLTGISAQNLIDAGYLDSSGNITNIKEGSYEREYGVATGNITLFIPSLLADQSRTYRFYTNYLPSVAHKIIVGYDGYITTSDNASLELGDNFTVELDGWIDTISAESILQIENCDDVWTEANSVTVSANTTDKLEGTASVQLDTPSFSADNLLMAYKNFASVDLSQFTSVRFWMKCSVAGYAGVVKLLLDDTDGCDSPLETLSIPVLTTTWTEYTIDLSNPSALTDVKSVGLYKTTEFNVKVLKVDNIRVLPTFSYLVNKPDSFQIYSGSGNITAYSYGTSVTATGVSSGEHVVLVSSNVTNLAIFIDSVQEDVTTAVSVPDTANNWTFMQSNSMPYASSISISVNSTQQLLYEPISMISGTTLPDRAGTPQNGTITWGTNPAGVEVTIGSIMSDEATTASTTGISGISHKFEEAAEPSGWFVTGTFGGTLTPELKEAFANAASDIGMPEQSLWLFIWFGVSVAIGLSVLLFTGSILIALMTVIVGLWAGTNANVIDFGLVFLVIVIGLGTFYLAKQH